MSTRLVSILGIAALGLGAVVAKAADGQSAGRMRLTQMPAFGTTQNDANNPPGPRDVSDTPVRIMNFSQGVFRYQVSRTSGKTWTDYYNLPSGQMHQFNPDKRSAPSIVRTLNGSGSPGYVFIRYPVPGGFEQFKVLGDNAYGYVINGNGYGELVEPNLAGRPVPRVPAGAQELQLFQLYANHSYFDTVPDQQTPSPGPIVPREPTMPRSQ